VRHELSLFSPRTDERVQQTWEESKQAAEREQKLMLSAFYELGLEMARGKVRAYTPLTMKYSIYIAQAKQNPLSAGPTVAPAEPNSFLGRKRLQQRLSSGTGNRK
jgi:hypothetical protein